MFLPLNVSPTSQHHGVRWFDTESSEWDVQWDSRYPIALVLPAAVFVALLTGSPETGED